jgi:uncharacterized protein (DUF302 family)
MATSLHSVHYSSTHVLPASQRLCVSAFPFDQTLLILKNAISNEDLWLIHEIDPQILMARGGYEILPTRQLLFFHPRYLFNVLENDINAIIEAPLKLIIMQMPDRTVTVRHTNIVDAFSRFNGLDHLASELTQKIERILKAVMVGGH